MKNYNSAIFNRLLALKKEGYTYLTSCDGEDDYTGYDQAVADCYEDGDGNEPSYGDWIREIDLDSGKYVTFHSNLLIYGEFSYRFDYETEIIDLDYDQENMIRLYRIFFGHPYHRGIMKDKGLREDFDARYVDIIAYSIWNLNFENENQTLDSIERFTEFYEKEEYYFFGGEYLITAFVKADLWDDVKFIENILTIKHGPDNEIIKSFLSQRFKITNDAFYIQHFPEDLSIYMLLPDKYPAEVRNALEKEGNLFKLLPEELKADKELALHAAKGGASLHLFNSEIKSDTEIIKTYISKLNVKWDTDTLEHVSEEFKANKEFIKSLVSINGFVLKDVSDELKNDKDVVSPSVKQNGGTLEYASDELKADKDVVVLAVSNPNIKDTFGNIGGSFEHASDELKTDKEVVLAAVSNEGNALRYASEALKADKEVVMTAISCEGLRAYSYCIKYALKDFNPDKEMVIAIVSKLGNALEYAANEFKADHEVVMAAISSEGLYASSYCIKYALKDFNPDKEMVIAIVSKLGEALKHASDEFKSDLDVVKAAVFNYGYALQYASNELKADKEVVMAAVSNDQFALKFASEELQNDPDIIAIKG